MDNSHDVNWKSKLWVADRPKLGPGFPEDVQKIMQQFTRVECVLSSPHLLLDELGCRGSDLLQATGIIWVEGPSDVVYLDKWIEMYCHEEKQVLRKGIDDEYQMFAGALLDSICLVSEGLKAEVQYKKLVEMFSFSRNAFVVIDSDAVRKKDGTLYDKSNFREAKGVISKQIQEKKSEGYRLGIWFEDGNTDVKTIEDYLDRDSIAMNKKHESKTKKIYAQKVTESWRAEKKLSDFGDGLEARVGELISVIQSWQ